MRTDIIKDFLSSFFILMDLVVISYGKVNNIALGIITGKDEKIDDLIEHLYFIWRIDKPSEILSDLIKLCNFLKENNLVDGDKILISENELIDRIDFVEWDLPKRKYLITELLSIDIRMIYNGEETDSSFLHF